MEIPDYELHTNIGGQLQNLYQAYEHAEEPLATWIRRGYVWSEVEKRRVLFVGMNPSYVDGAEPESYSFDPLEAVNDYPRFFRPFDELAKACGAEKDWTYTDVFAFRETNQDQLWKVMASEEGLEFIVKQLRLTMRLLEHLKPELIVVCNSGARQFFGADRDGMDNIWMGYKFAFDTAFGVDVVTGISSDSVESGAKTTGLIGTPVLFAPTLSYMDRSSKKRLAWQMSQILKFYPLFTDTEYDGLNDPISLRIAKVAMKIARLQKTKNEMIQKRHYEPAAHKRDQIAEVKEEVLELLVRVVGERNTSET